MKERPILFSAPMVQAILAGEKVQTRRIVKVPYDVPEGDWYLDRYNKGPFWTHWERVNGQDTGKMCLPEFCCPYGEAGDKLWVRETWATEAHLDSKAPSRFAGWPVWYAADDTVQRCGSFVAPRQRGKTRPSIFMPRWASRILLEITDIRAQRLQDISEADAQAEGAPAEFEVDVATFVYGQPLSENTHYLGFKHLWKEINGKDSWDSNPWVWAISFKQVQS